jgi:general secretion pathway protein G
MRIQKTKLGFTLIELLVVITIIGILATWAVSVYTSQIQKARDSTRLTDITAVKWWIEQFYQDNAEYPYSTNADATTPELNFSGVLIYTPKLPEDPKSWNERSGAAFDYIYTVWQDENLIDWQDFEISTTFENKWNIDHKAIWDWWNDDARLELWVDLGWNSTKVTAKITAWSLKCVAVGGGVATACSTTGTMLVIKK